MCAIFSLLTAVHFHLLNALVFLFNFPQGIILIYTVAGNLTGNYILEDTDIYGIISMITMVEV
jgi:hypothetical protein